MGESYRDFLPLNQYALRIACAIFGVLDSIFYVKEYKEVSSKIQNALEVCDSKCLILAPNDRFNGILEIFAPLHKKLESKNAMCVENTHLQIVLLDLQKATQQELAEIARVVGSYENTESLLYLYPLGIEATSARMLLSGIAMDFGVRVNVLNQQHLEVLSAVNGDLKGFKLAIKEEFGDRIFATFDLAKSVIELLEKKNLKITSAESCTGGLIATMLTRQSGASAVFDGGVISYANAIKEAWLGVSAENLTSFGAVSEAVVRDMLDGVLKLSGAHFALATSGIAGPNGGSASKPVGTVYIGAKSICGAEVIERLHFNGDRNFIQEQATLYAYLLFLKIFFKNY